MLGKILAVMGCTFIHLLLTTNIFAQDTKISGQWFISYINGEVKEELNNQFIIKRGYITVKTKINDFLSGRITPDISIDREGDSIGDLELRLKYCYAKVTLPNTNTFFKSYFEIGLAHRPWLNFEENLTGYRVLGSMFLPRNGVVSSADFGVLFATYLGGEMDKDYQKNVNKYYPGKYGSIAIGVFNGGGYHALETNTNKPIETRFTLRPMPEYLPGFQVSYTGAYGKGNTKESPDWILHQGFVSYETRRFVVTGSYYQGVGNFTGKAVDSLGNALDQKGYSLFGAINFYEINSSLFGRFDYFDQEKYSVISNRRIYILGWAYHIYKYNKVLLYYNRRDDDISFVDSNYLEVAMEIRF